MEEMPQELKEKITSVKEFDITENRLNSKLNKNENWTAPGVNGTQNV